MGIVTDIIAVTFAYRDEAILRVGLSIRASRQVERDKVNLTLEEISFSTVVPRNTLFPSNQATNV